MREPQKATASTGHALRGHELAARWRGRPLRERGAGGKGGEQERSSPDQDEGG
jgi:type II secretory pathway component PulM